MMMTSNLSRQARESSSSKPTVVSERSDAVLILGKKLIGELKVGNTTDTLTRWMIHYIAELIKNAERRSAKNRPAQLEKCCETILALWRHRHELPDGKHPFERLEPVLRALESLDPSLPKHRYYPSARPVANETEESAASRKWLELADDLDDSARILIRHCLARAAASAINKHKEWVALAEQAGCDDVELQILKIIIVEHDMNNISDPKDEQRKLLEDRVGKLRTLIALATTVSNDYTSQLKLNKPRPKTKKAAKPGAARLASRLAKPKRVIVETRITRRKRTTKS